MIKEKSIDANDLELILFTDSIDKAKANLQTYAIEKYGLKKKKPKKSWLLSKSVN